VDRSLIQEEGNEIAPQFIPAQPFDQKEVMQINPDDYLEEYEFQKNQQRLEDQPQKSRQKRLDEKQRLEREKQSFHDPSFDCLT